MYRVLRSYSRKAERKHEVTKPDGTTIDPYSTIDGAHRNGAVMPADRGDVLRAGAWTQAVAGGGYSESSSYEAHEHYERKMQRVKKTRSDRDKARSKSQPKKVHSLFSSIFIISHSPPLSLVVLFLLLSTSQLCSNLQINLGYRFL